MSTCSLTSSFFCFKFPHLCMCGGRCIHAWRIFIIHDVAGHMWQSTNLCFASCICSSIPLSLWISLSVSFVFLFCVNRSARSLSTSALTSSFSCFKMSYLYMCGGRYIHAWRIFIIHDVAGHMWQSTNLCFASCICSSIPLSLWTSLSVSFAFLFCVNRSARSLSTSALTSSFSWFKMSHLCMCGGRIKRLSKDCMCERREGEGGNTHARHLVSDWSRSCFTFAYLVVYA